MEGASLFSILPKHRDRPLLELLVAYQIMWDFLDSVSERGACAGRANGRQLHRALVEALDPEAPISDYYRFHPWKDDGGYLLALVETCRRICAKLPSYQQVRSILLRGVERCSIQSLNHEPEPSRRDTALKEWAKREFPDKQVLDWFELTAAASAFVPYALLALASEPARKQSEIARVHAAYFPAMSLAIAMLDSYVDQTSDIANASHSYISHYPSKEMAMERLAAIVSLAVSNSARLPNGYRHVVIATCMVSMYLSKESVNTSTFRAQTRELAQAGGKLMGLLLPAARVWRIANARRITSRQASGGLPQGFRLPSIVQTVVFWKSPFAYYERSRRRHGSRFTLRATSHPPFVFFSDPDDIRALVTAPADVLHPGEGANTIRPLIGDESFMVLEGDEHLNGRRVILPAFRRKIVQRHAGLVAGIVHREAASWPKDTPVALHPRLRRLTAEVIVRTTFGPTSAISEPGVASVRERILAMMSVAASPVLSEPMLRYGPGRRVWKRFLRQRSEADELIYALIDEQRYLDHDDAADVFSRLLTACNLDGLSMSRRQLRDNVMTLILSGHETTSAELAWAFQLLAHNPSVQERLIEEIDADAGDEYLTATVQEVLRHRPVFLFTIPRAVKQPIEIGGWIYEPPAHLLGCIYLLHHDPQIYSEPNEFRPERFLEGQPSPHTWLPWGGGRKRCPGMHLAMLEMKTVLRTVLQSMTINPASRRMERPRWRSVIVTPHAGSRVVLRRRERASAVGGHGRSVSTAGVCPVRRSVDWTYRNG